MSVLANRLLTSVSLVACISASASSAQDQGVTYTFFGTPGLLEMPSAVAPAEGEIAATFSGYGPYQRNAFTFQVTQRLSATFRYGSTEDYALPGFTATPGFDYYDRSFDLRYRLLDEGDWAPSVAIGLQDFLGTGQYGGEYIVATKTFGDAIRATVGLGWGRLASEGGFTNPLGLIDASLETRPTLDFGQGGQVEADQFFRGDAALFGGVEWAATDALTFKAEYSSDGHVRESELGLIDPASPLNFGVTYTPRPGIYLTAAYLHGSELGLGGTITFNPNDRPIDGGFDSPPVPVVVRDANARAAQSWDRNVLSEQTLRGQLSAAMAREGLTLTAVELTDRTARVRFTNTRYRTEAQALGRAARIMSDILPPSIETFTLEPMARGIAVSAATMRRTDIERYETVAGGTSMMQERVVLSDAGTSAGLQYVEPDQTFFWGISPFAQLTVFNGDNPVSADYGLNLSASYEIQPNLVLSGSVRKSFVRDRELGDISPSTLPAVRREGQRYDIEGDGGIRTLQLSHFGRPGANLYSRVTVGYLEPAFGGISTELLYSPVNTAWAVGGELNYVAQRDFDLGFGFQDYDVLTGHASVYYDFDNGFHGQVDVGRYLAGDWGATVTIDREFDNGWRLGGYFTITDVDPEEFGEGSFDKGLRITVPLDYFVGSPSTQEFSNTLTSLTRDGGARLNVDGRLYETVRDAQANELADGWGRFWR